MSHARRRRAFATGRRAEALAAWLLRLKGYRILARRWQGGVGEIDIVARRGSVLAFVEVKARANREAALTALTVRQRRRLVRAAETYVARFPQFAGLDLRFDMILLAPGHLPRHILDAWQA